MPEQDPEFAETFPVTIAVVVSAQAVDERDAVKVAEGAVREALSPILTTRTWDGYPRTVRVSSIAEINQAIRDSAVQVTPTIAG